MAQQTSSKQLFDLLVSKNFDPELLDSAGKPASNPTEAEVFSFDFTTESGNNYGTVVIMLGENNDLEVFFGDNVGKTMEGADKNEWYSFLEQLKHFSVKNLMSFGLKNINRLRYSMQGQAAIKEGLFESWRGTKTVSYNDKPEAVRLMIKHKKPIGENDARYRYIESLYVETADGERFKLPFTKLAGGRAMIEHVRNGGRPYDARGQHIAAVVEELNVLSRFRRANHGKVFEGDTETLIAETNTYYENLNRVLKGLGTHRGYTNYFESWNPSEITEQDVVIESIKNLFVRETIDTRIEQALPVLAKIQKQGQAMKEVNMFEAWANRLTEGTWATPETPEQKKQLVNLLSKDFPVGADALNATEQLYDLLGDDQLFDQLEKLANQDANADGRQIVLNRLIELGEDPNIAEVIAQLNIDTDPADELDVEVDAEEQVDEEQLDEFLPALGAIAGGVARAGAGALGALGRAAVTATGRSVGDALGDVFSDDEDEVDEGVLGTIAGGIAGSLGGAALSGGNPLATVVGGMSGSALGNRLTKDKPAEGKLGALAGGAVGGAATKSVRGVIGGAQIGSKLQDIFSKDKVKEVIDPTNPRDYEIPAYLRKQQGQAPLTPADVKAKDEKSQREFQKRVGNIDEADNLSTFEEGRCNMTAEGTECPKHGMSECWTKSAQDNGDTDTLARLKTLSGITNR